MKQVIWLTGPTASGKTAQAVRLARAVSGEVVNFDSLLFYRELNIGTAKPSVEERQDIPHHMVDIRSITHPMNASDFAREAFPVVESIHQSGKIVVLVGGSGFYAQALLKGMWDSPTTPLDVELRSDNLYEAEGIIPFREILRIHDPTNFMRLHENDHYRIRRAVEHFWVNGTPFSQQKEIFKPSAPDWDVLHLHLDIPKEEHWQIISQRTHGMLEHGLIEEVQDLLKQGFTGQEKPLQAIGYKETVAFLAGDFKGDRALYEERIVLNTRQLAKTQRTWFKKIATRSYDPRKEGDSLLSAAKIFTDLA